MNRLNKTLAKGWVILGPRFLPFANAATEALPLGRLLRLSLFQVSVGMAVVLLNGTLNRVMIVELGVPASLVAVLIALPLVFAPLRALLGFRSDHHRSAFGWRRVPYIWMGTLLQYGGLAITPFALILLSGDSHGPEFLGPLAVAVSFLLIGAGMHTAQTAGLALATDLAPEDARPRVVALLYFMLLLGMVGSSLAFGALLADFSQFRLIQVIQTAAVVTMVFNVIALWKQEVRDPKKTASDRPRPRFMECWRALSKDKRPGRLLLALGLGTAAFAMQDILLEPYGGEVLGLTVGATTALTALLAGGTLIGFTFAARSLDGGQDPLRLAAYGALVGVVAFTAVILAAPFESPMLFRLGTAVMGFGGGLYAVGMLTAAMGLARDGQSGLALGVWGAVQATAAGLAMALGGALRDAISSVADAGYLGPALTGPSTGYGSVYFIEILLLFATVAVIGPLVRASRDPKAPRGGQLGLAEFPG